MSNYIAFLDKLIAKSAQARIAWRPSVESDSFIASLETEFAITVSKTAHQEFRFEMRDQRGNLLLALSAEKSRAWEQGYEEAVEVLDRLQKLHMAAHHVALDVDRQLKRAEFLLDQA